MASKPRYAVSGAASAPSPPSPFSSEDKEDAWRVWSSSRRLSSPSRSVHWLKKPRSIMIFRNDDCGVYSSSASEEEDDAADEDGDDRGAEEKRRTREAMPRTAGGVANADEGKEEE